MPGPRHGQDLWLRALTTVALVPVVFVGMGVVSCCERHNSFAALSEPVRKEIAALPILPNESALVERAWFNSGFDGDELAAPIGPPPCPAAAQGLPYSQRAAARAAFAALKESRSEERIRRLGEINDRDKSNLLVALIAGRELVENEHFKLAEQLLWKSLDATDRAKRILNAAYAPPSAHLDFSDDEIYTVIHLHYVLGVTELRPSPIRPPWIALKNVIGTLLPLSRRRTLGLIPGESRESRLLIRPPGCPDSQPGSLTSHDLYNNLIVGYVRGNYRLKPTDQKLRDHEFKRDGKDVENGVRRLFRGLARQCAAGCQNESRLWALSNADRVFDQGIPDHTRLAYNIARQLDWWIENPTHCPATICTEGLRAAVRRDRDALVMKALTERDVDENAQHEAFAKGTVRMVVQSDINPAAVKNDLDALRGWLPAAQQRILDDFFAAQSAREAIPKWVVKPDQEKGTPPWSVLGPRAAKWREAALDDFAEAVGRWGENRPAKERKQAAAALRRLLAPAPLPADVDHRLLPGGGGFWFVLWTSPWFWKLLAVAAAVATWLLIVWVLLQVREYRLLRKSFYELELDFIDHIDVPGARR